MNDRCNLPSHSTDASQPVQQARRRLVDRIFGWLMRRTDAELCAPDSLPLHGIHRILICRVNHRLGNNVLLSATLRELETLYPGAEIDIASAGDSARALFAERFQVNRVLCLSRRAVRHPWQSLRWLLAIRATTYDLAVDPCVRSHSGRLLLGLCNARFKVGFPYANHHPNARHYSINRPSHMAKCGVFLSRTAHAGTTDAHWPPLDVQLAAAERQRGRDTLQNLFRDGFDPDRPIIGVFPHASGNKRLAESWWLAFVATLQQQRPQLRLLNILAHHGQSQLPDSLPPIYSSDLRKLASVLGNLQGFISADCGVMHLAAAVGTPTLGLFTRPNLATYAPYGAGNRGIHVAPDAHAADVARLAATWLDQIPACMPQRSDASAEPRRQPLAFASP